MYPSYEHLLGDKINHLVRGHPKVLVSVNGRPVMVLVSVLVLVVVS